MPAASGENRSKTARYRRTDAGSFVTDFSVFVAGRRAEASVHDGLRPAGRGEHPGDHPVETGLRDIERARRRRRRSESPSRSPRRPSVGSTIQLNPRSWTVRASSPGFLTRSIASSIDLSTPSTSSSVHVRGRVAQVMDFLGDGVVTLAQHDFDVV